MKPTSWSIKITDLLNGKTIARGHFEGSFPKCQKFIKEKYLNKKNPITKSGSQQYYNLNIHRITIETYL